MSHTATCALDPHHSHEEPGNHHEHSHVLVDRSIVRSRTGLRSVAVTLGILGVTAIVQAAIYVATGSIALLADLIHNAGDALTALPLGAAFLLRSERAERGAGLAAAAGWRARHLLPTVNTREATQSLVQWWWSLRASSPWESRLPTRSWGS
jgi:hypothetical protein